MLTSWPASTVSLSHRVATYVPVLSEVLVTLALIVMASPISASDGLISTLVTVKFSGGNVSEPDMAKTEKRVMVTV